MATCRVSKGIINVGVQTFKSVPINIGIATGFSATLSIGSEDIISEPVNPLAAHIGGGTVLFHYEAPLSGSVQEYEIEASTSLTGKYFSYNRNKFQSNIACVKGFPFGVNLYFRIRALSATGKESNWVQVRRGTVQKQTKPMMITTIYGSTIPQGSKFNVVDDCGRVSGFESDESLVITGLTVLTQLPIEHE